MPVRARTQSRAGSRRTAPSSQNAEPNGLGYLLLLLLQQRQRVSSRTELVATLFANHYHDRLFATADIYDTVQ